MSLEVDAGQAFGLFFPHLKKQGIDPERLVEGTGLPLTTIQQKHARIDWEDFVKTMRNVGRIWTDEQLVQIGSGYFDSPLMRPFSVVARLIFTAVDFYKWVFVKTMGVGNQTFSCIEASLEEPAAGVLILQLTLPEKFEVAREFFVLSRGTFIGMPRILGLPRAEVDLEWLPRGARFHVKVPPGGGLLGRLKRALMWPFTVRAAASELKTAHETLRTRYNELQDAQQVLTVQAKQLKTVNELGRDLTQHTELASLGDAFARVLNERFRCTGVRLAVATDEGGERLVHETGAAAGDTATFPLVAGGKQLGTLQIWGYKPASAEDPEAQLLRDLVPWFSIALDNARSFAQLREYQAHLEQRVRERTAELQKTSEQLKEALDHQKEIDKQKTEFFANASHELRTPLTLLLGPLETLSKEGRLPDAARLELTAALRNGYRLIKLVNDLLDLSKIEAGRLTLRMGPTNLSRLLEEVLRPWGPALQKRGIRLDANVRTPVRVVADPERLEQVMLNLVSNAVRHTPDGGFLRVEAAQEGEKSFFRVENSGEGIDPEDVGRIFERFGQSLHSRSRRFGSSGLGLSVVREIVELHGGKVTLDNHPGERVAFRVDIPTGGEVDEALREAIPNPSSLEMAQYESTAINEASLTSPAVAPASEQDASLPLVLVVEDNNDLRAFITRGLSNEFQVVEAANGADGIEAAKRHNPNIILSDFMMPIMDGIEMCKRLKADKATSGIPIVMLTARGDLEAKLMGLGGGADDFVVKPFHVEEVRARLHTQLRLRQLTAKLSVSEKLAALGTLVGGVAHEVRNPLNAIINALRPLRELVPDKGDGVHELIDAALTAAQRVENVSNQLLTQARAGEGGFGPVDLGANISLALQMLAHKAQPGPQIVCNVPSDHAVKVEGESGALNQIWINLIDNAILAAGPQGRVTVTVRDSDAAALVEVSDNGPGIAPSILSRIFDPFFTTRDVGKGTGLGLAVVREIVEKHKGTIAVHSKPGEGAKFQVTLPSLGVGEAHARG